MTIRELFREFAAARLRAEDDDRRSVTLAWHTVRIYIKTKANKRLPSLQELLRQTERPVKQTPRQMFVALSAVSQKYGIPLRERQVH
jgi:hypothetical protein